MGIVLGLSEGSGVDLILGAMALFIGAIGLYVKLKTKADKADTMKEVDKKLTEELKPIIKSMEEYERDIKELRKDELEPIKQNINILMREQDVMNTILSTLVKTLDRNHEESNRNHIEIKEIMKERDRSYKENFLLLFEKLERKVDKKG